MPRSGEKGSKPQKTRFFYRDIRCPGIYAGQAEGGEAKDGGGEESEGEVSSIYLSYHHDNFFLLSGVPKLFSANSSLHDS